jgi:ferredoxin
MAALLVVGNLFCMACPFMLVRDAARRVFPPKLRWPKALRNKWLVSVLFLVYLWAYEQFGLWNSPWLTAWIIGGYFLAAVLVDGLFKGATFCKYVCPIGQFHFVTSLVSPREIAVKNQAVCQSCKTFDCIKGNSKARGCELDLFQPKKIGNLDCTFCLDCVKACPHDNVGLISVIPGKTLLSNTYRSSIGRLSKRKDWVFLVLIIVFGGFGNAAAMTDTVMMWPYKWLLLLLPLAALALCTGQSARFSLALAPVGIGMWAAHAAFHALAAMPLEILLLDAGLLLALYLIWRIAAELASGTMKTLQLAAPWAALAISLYCAGVWILFQPMEMRGMM